MEHKRGLYDQSLSNEMRLLVDATGTAVFNQDLTPELRAEHQMRLELKNTVAARSLFHKPVMPKVSC